MTDELIVFLSARWLLGFWQEGPAYGNASERGGWILKVIPPARHGWKFLVGLMTSGLSHAGSSNTNLMIGRIKGNGSSSKWLVNGTKDTISAVLFSDLSLFAVVIHELALGVWRKCAQDRMMG